MPATNPNLIYDEPAGPFQSAPTRRPRTAAEIAAMTPEEQEALYGTIRATPETGHGWMTNILSHLTGPFSSDEREAWQMAETLGQPLELAGVPMAYDAVSNIKRGIEEENSGDIARGVGQGALVALPGAAALRAASPVARAAAPAALGTLGGLAMLPEEAEARAEKRKRIQAKRESSLGHTPGKTIESHIDPKSGQRLMMSPEEGAARAHEREPSSIEMSPPREKAAQAGSTDDVLLQQLTQERQMVADRLKQESASGFGARSQNAASRLAGIDKQIEVIRRRQNTPSMTDYLKPLAVGLGIGGIAGGAFGRIAATRANKRVMEFEQIAKNLGDLSNAKGNVVGTQAGDRMAAGVDAAYRTGGAVAPELGRDIALMANPASREARDRAIALAPEAATDTASSGPFQQLFRPTPGAARDDAIERASAQTFGRQPGMFDRARPYEDNALSKAADFTQGMAVPAGLTGTGYFETQVLAPMAERDDPSTPQIEGSPDLANLIRQVGNVSIGAGLGYKSSNAFTKKGGFRALSKDGFPLKPSAKAQASVEAGRNRLERDIGTFRNGTADNLVNAKSAAPAVPVKTAPPPALPNGAVGATPDKLREGRDRVRQIIDTAHSNDQVLSVLPEAMTLKGEPSAAKLQASLQRRGINVNRAQAQRMIRKLRSAGKL